MKSILQSEKECYICGSQQWLENHHVFFGTANRKLSEKYGLTVYLCHGHHNEPPLGMHHNKQENEKLSTEAQKIWMRTYKKSKQNMIDTFGMNYLSDEDYQEIEIEIFGKVVTDE